MIRLLHLSDVHLGADLREFGPVALARRQEILDIFRGLPQIAETEQADAVLIAGDLFDTARPTDYILAVVRQTLRRLVDSGRPVFLIPGNHDAITCNPGLYSDVFGGATVFREPRVGDPVSVQTEAGALHVYGLAYDWTLPEPLGTYRRADLPGAHVMLLHGATPSVPHWRAHPNALRIPLEWLATVEADYVALGDAHSFRGPGEFEWTEPVRASYCGSFASVDLGETGSHGYVVADVEPGEPPVVRHVATRARPVVDVGTIDVGPLPSEAAVAAAISGRVPDGAFPVARLTGEPLFPLQVSRIVVELEQRFGCARVEDASWSASTARLDEVADQDTIAGHIVRLGRRRLADAGDDPAAALIAERALRVALRALRVEG